MFRETVQTSICASLHFDDDTSFCAVDNGPFNWLFHTESSPHPLLHRIGEVPQTGSAPAASTSPTSGRRKTRTAAGQRATEDEGWRHWACLALVYATDVATSTYLDKGINRHLRNPIYSMGHRLVSKSHKSSGTCAAVANSLD